MFISRFLMLALLGMLLSWTARAADTRPDCHSCHIESHIARQARQTGWQVAVHP
jgi:hypothetical protein